MIAIYMLLFLTPSEFPKYDWSQHATALNPQLPRACATHVYLSFLYRCWVIMFREQEIQRPCDLESVLD